jgi:hypothetical protein
MKTLMKAISYVSLGVLILGPILYFFDKVVHQTSIHFMLAGTVGWFATAPFWMKSKSGS